MSQPAPTVSVVIPTWNRAALALEALESVFAQDLWDLEAILVDDGSTDGTVEQIGMTLSEEPRLRVVRKENGGAASARNRGLEEARGTYVAFLDSDDLYRPHALRSQVACLEQSPETAVAICDAAYEGGWKQDGQTVFSRKHFRPPTCLRAMLDGAFVTASMLVVRREAVGKIRFDESLRVCEDIEFLMHLYAEGLGSVLNPQVLVRYRHHGAQAMDDDDAIRMGTVRVLEKYGEHADEVGATLYPYQVARRKATHHVKHGRLAEAKPYLRTWLRHRFSSRAFRWWVRSFFP